MPTGLEGKIDAEKVDKMATEQKIIEFQAPAARDQLDAAGFTADSNKAARAAVGIPEAAVERERDGDNLVLNVAAVTSIEEVAGYRPPPAVEYLFYRVVDEIAIGTEGGNGGRIGHRDGVGGGRGNG